MTDVTEVESALLSAYFQSPEDVMDAAAALTPRMFMDPVIGHIWRTLLDLNERGQRVDVPTLAMTLSRDRTFPRASDVVLDAASPTGIPALADRYAQQIQDAYRRRCLTNAMARMLDACSSDLSTADLLDMGREMIEDIDDEAVDGDPIGADMQGWWDEKMSPSRLLPVPWRQMDECMIGLAPGSLTVIAAPPGGGKSVMAMQMARHIAGMGKAVVYTSTEMSQRELIDRLASAESGVPIGSYLRGPLNEDEVAKTRAARHIIDALPLWINPERSPDVRNIRRHARQVVRKTGNLGLIVVDYLQQVRSTNHRHSEYEAVGEVSAALKRLAMELDVPIIVVSSMNRSWLPPRGEDDKETMPTLASLRGSGTIGHDADLVLIGTGVNEQDMGTVSFAVVKFRQGSANQWIRFRNQMYVMRLV